MEYYLLNACNLVMINYTMPSSHCHKALPLTVLFSHNSLFTVPASR